MNRQTYGKTDGWMNETEKVKKTRSGYSHKVPLNINQAMNTRTTGQLTCE